MPKRFCLECGEVFDREATGTLRCPACQPRHDQANERRRAKVRGTAAQRGYGTAHRTTRDRALDQWAPGQPCAHCGEPMWTRDDLDLAHTDDRTGYRGLAHATCNRGHR